MTSRAAEHGPASTASTASTAGTADPGHESPRWGVDAFAGIHALVAGWGASGRSATSVLVDLGARVTVLDGDPQADLDDLPSTAHAIVEADEKKLAERAATLEAAVLIASPGWAPTHPVLISAAARGVPIWSEVELAWQIADPATRWFTLTGTNGKTTTVGMVAAILTAAGRRAPAVGNVGVPIAQTVLGARASGTRLDALAVELSSFQLHYTHSVSAVASAVLNIADDHIDWHGSATAYAAAKGRIHDRTQVACLYHRSQPLTRDLVAEADVIDGARGIGFGLDTPTVGHLGLVETTLVDRAFTPSRHSHAQVLGELEDLRHLAGPTGLAPHVVSNALAAAGLARADQVPPETVAAGLATYHPGRHRLEFVETVAGVHYVNDSKATNSHAAAAALGGFDDSLIWIAGGLAKGAQFDDLVRAHGHRLRAAVIIGADPTPMTEALSRHAPQVPLIVIDAGDDEVMQSAVLAAADLAQPGDSVLLAPAGASMDQFRSYAARGEAFVDAVRTLDGQR